MIRKIKQKNYLAKFKLFEIKFLLVKFYLRYFNVSYKNKSNLSNVEIFFLFNQWFLIHYLFIDIKITLKKIERKTSPFPYPAPVESFR